MRTLFKAFLLRKSQLLQFKSVFCRFTRMSFLPLLFQRRSLARFHSESLGGVSHSDGHSVFNRKTKKPIHRHQKSAGALLSLQNDVLCIGFEIQRRDCLFIRSLADSTKKHKVWTAVFSLSTPKALGSFATFSIKTSCIQL